ncbi:MAG: RodZ domain-containing protein [Pseudomonadota bacterium]
MSEIETPTEPLVTASEMLFSARTAMGLSQKEVADQLFLTTTFIRYIDDGEFEKIPKAAFIKGYIRSYARVVGLDGNEVIAVYERDQELPLPTPAVGNVTEGPLEQTGFQGPIVQTGIFGLVALVLVALLVWWLASGDEPAPAVTPPVPEAPEIAAPRTSTAQLPDDRAAVESLEPEPGDPLPEGPSEGTVIPEPAAPAPATVFDRNIVSATAPGTAAGATPDDDSGSSAGPAEPAPTMEVATADEPDDAPPADTEAEKAVQVERVVDGETTYITIYAAGEDEMQFSFNDECWVEVTDADGDKIYGDLNRAGDIMTVYGRAPFDVLLGRAPATSMTFQGQPVDLERFTTRDQTARVRTARL